MIAADAYRNLTPTAKSQLREEVLAILQERRIACSRDYLTMILQGVREAPCGDEIANVISAYFRGFTGIDVSPADVRASVAGWDSDR